MNLLGPFYFHRLADPWILYLLPLVFALFALEFFARPFSALTMSTGDTLAKIKGNQAWVWLRKLPVVLRALALVLLLIALARPLSGIRLRVEQADVRDILLAVDVSGSMTAEDFVEGTRTRDRLYVTKVAVRDFIETRKLQDADRFGLDRVGLVLYAAYAWLQCPLTLDYDVLQRELNAVRIDNNDAKHTRTAIGSALGLSVRTLYKSEAKSKVIILLTDGINNHGPLDPITAAQLAKDYDIRIYTIGAGSTESGRFFGGSNNPIDEESLKRIARLTGGKYYRASDTESLQGAYQEINELETTEVDVADVYEYDEGFVVYAFAGMVFMAASIFGRRRWFDAIP